MNYSPFPVGLTPNNANPSAKGLQNGLYRAGYWPQGVAFADNYGPTTQATMVAFHKDHLDAPVVTCNLASWQKLMYQAFSLEPNQDMTRTTYSGRTVNGRTAGMLLAAGVFRLSQGSYNHGVSASAGTHDGGGVVDVNISSLDNVERQALVLRLREVGFAAWLRTPDEGFPYHIHACAIGDREMAPAAVEQVHQYFHGQNGLANHGPDTFSVRPAPAWAAKYRN